MSSCPFYLVVGTWRIAADPARSYSEGIEINAEEMDIDDLDTVRDYFCESVKDCNKDYIDTILVIKNDTCGGPKIVQHWA